VTPPRDTSIPRIDWFAEGNNGQLGDVVPQEVLHLIAGFDLKVPARAKRSTHSSRTRCNVRVYVVANIVALPETFHRFAVFGVGEFSHGAILPRCVIPAARSCLSLLRALPWLWL